MLCAFAERNNFGVMNTFFRKRKNRKCSCKGPNGETKNDTELILTGTSPMVHDVQVIGRVKRIDHGMVRCRIHLDFRKERMNMLKGKMPKLLSKGKREMLALLKKN